MSNFYCTVESVRSALEREGEGRDASIYAAIAAASRSIDAMLTTRPGAFIPETATRLYDWPQHTAASFNSPGQVLFLDEWLISLSALTSDNANNTITFSTDVFLEPQRSGPPFTRLEIDHAATNASAYFGAKTTSQQAISVAGSWGFELNTSAVGNLNGALSDTTGTSVSLTDGSRTDAGHTLLVGSEQLFVSAASFEDIGQNESGALTAALSDNALTLGGAPTDAVVVGEMLRIGSEQMKVTGITSTTVFTVERAVNGTVLAAHSDTDDVFVRRTYTVERGVNGTTAATQLDDAAVTRFVIPGDVELLCTAMAISSEVRGGAGWTAGNQPSSDAGIATLRAAVMGNHRYSIPIGLMFG